MECSYYISQKPVNNINVVTKSGDRWTQVVQQQTLKSDYSQVIYLTIFTKQHSKVQKIIDLYCTSISYKLTYVYMS